MVTGKLPTLQWMCVHAYGQHYLDLMDCLKEEGRERGDHGERQCKAGREVLGRIQEKFEGGNGCCYENISLCRCLKVSTNKNIKYK